MQEINKILGKVWRNQDLTMEEIKILAENKLETVNKIEIKMYENKLIYVVFFENYARRYVGFVVSEFKPLECYIKRK